MNDGLLSDSECLVIGTLLAANSSSDEPFFGQFEVLIRMLGLASGPIVTDTFQYVPDVPSDTIWGTTDGADRLTADDITEIQESRRAEMRLTKEWIDRVDGISNGFHSAFEQFLQQYLAVGYAQSTPTKAYCLAITGEMHVLHETAPLHHGLIRMLIEMLGPTTAMPLRWRMAVPRTIGDVPADFWTTSFVPGSAIVDMPCGHDDSAGRDAMLRQLNADSTSGDAFCLGGSIWRTLVLIREFVRGTETSGAVSPTKAEQPPQPAPPKFGEHVPELVRDFFHVCSAVQQSDQVNGDPDDERGLIGLLAQISAELTEARSAAQALGMPNVISVLDELFGLLVMWKHNVRFFGSLGVDMTLAAQRIDEGIQMAHAALCVAYGDLLLRERYSPAPVPQGGARSRLLRLPHNVRHLVTTALGRLRRDSRGVGNFTVELTLLCNVLEHLVREAAALYIPGTRKHKVADLLYELLNAMPTAKPEDTGAIETVARVGIALHHAFRNPVVHQMATVRGTPEEAMFVAYGVLVLLDTLEHASQRG